MATSTTPPPQAEREGRPGLFVRKATGLVRELGPLDLFIFSVNNQNIGLGVLFVLLWIPAIYWGADLIWSTVIAGILCIFPVTAFALLNTIMPRSGGDYVWVSRVFGPWIGFGTSWNVVVWMWFYVGAPLAMVGKYGVASLLRYMGATYNNPQLVTAGEWFYSPWGQLILGTILLALFTWLFIIGTRKYMALQNILFAIATIGLVVVMAVMLTTTAERFETAFNDYVVKLGGTENAYDQVIELAAADPDYPLEVPDTIDWGQTFASSVWGIYIMAFAFYAAYLGGEIKSAKRTNLISMPLSIVYVTVFVCLVLAVFLRVPGIQFLGSLYYFDPDIAVATGEMIEPVLGMRGFVPHFNELAAIVAPPIIGIFMGIAFIFWTYAWMPISLVSSTRPIMAWSFDRLFPQMFSNVHPTYRTPVNAILLGALMGWISLALFSFDVYGLLSGTAGEFLVLGIVCLAAIILPYRWKKLYDGSSVAWYILGIPVLSIIGVLGLISTIYMEYLLITDPIDGLLVNPKYAWASLIVFASGFIIYPIIRAMRQREGVDVTLASREIPPE